MSQDNIADKNGRTIHVGGCVTVTIEATIRGILDGMVSLELRNGSYMLVDHRAVEWAPTGPGDF